MKKFIPYILIVAMIGTFLWISFTEPNKASAQAQEQENVGAWTWVKNEFGPGAWKAWGIGVYEQPARLFPGVSVVEYYWGDWGKIADATIGQMVSWISDFTWRISAKIFNMSSFLLDYAVDFAVKDFKTHIDQIKVIDTGYKIVLNVANMLFIFILLYIAIKTILGVGGDTKKLLTNIIVVGLFINFSLFMTKTIIDASNIVAMGFYNAVQTEVGQTKTEGGTDQVKMISVGSVSTAMMAGLKLQTQIPSPDSQYNKIDPSKGLTNFNIAMNNFGGSALFLVSAFVFISVALLFIVRFVALLFYMLFSPVAFLGMISPEMKEYSSKWWNGLQSQALFAPAFLFLAYLISAIINSGQLWKAVGGNDSTSTYYDAISSPSAGAFPIIMNYVILMALMIGALITAKGMADKGSAGVLKYTNKFQGWAQGVAGRNTVGRGAELANKWLDKGKERMEESRAGRTALGVIKYGSLGLAGGAKDLIESGKTTKFGSAQSREDIIKIREDEVAKGLKDRRDRPEKMAAYLAGLWPSERKAAYDKMSARDRAAVESAAPAGKARDVLKKLREKLSVEEKEKTDKARKDADADAKNRGIRDDIKRVAIGGINPATGIAYTPAEIDSLMLNLKSKETYKLIPDEPAKRANPLINPLLNPLVIDRLSTGHLSNLMAEGDLTPAEKLAIKTRVLTAAHIAAGTPQAMWMNDPTRLPMWS